MVIWTSRHYWHFTDAFHFSHRHLFKTGSLHSALCMQWFSNSSLPPTENPPSGHCSPTRSFWPGGSLLLWPWPHHTPSILFFPHHHPKPQLCLPPSFGCCHHLVNSHLSSDQLETVDPPRLLGVLSSAPGINVYHGTSYLDCKPLVFCTLSAL